MGYPSWGKLAEAADAAVSAATGGSYDAAEYKKLREQMRYPELFDRAAEDLGGVDALLERLRPLLVGSPRTGRVYQFLARWPFRWYLTTNYDDELEKHLEATGQHFTCLGNGRADLISLNDQTSRVVVKLHGTLASAEGLVLTETQYQAFKVQDSFGYFRDKLRALLSTLPVVVIGHSLADPDLALILEYAQTISAPGRPIYMILADADKATVRKYHDKYNIRIITYSNSDGSHSQLISTLRVIDRFVVPRSGDTIPLDFPDPRELDVASSLLLYSKLGLGARVQSFARRALEPQILKVLADAYPSAVTETAIVRDLVPAVVARHPDTPGHVAAALESFAQAGIAVTVGEGVAATPAGKRHYDAIAGHRRILEDQVYGALEAHLRRSVPGMSAEDASRFAGALRRSLIAAFRKRGLATSSLLFRGRPLERDDMADVFESVMNSVVAVDNFEARVAFVEFVMDLLTKPNEAQRAYLASISQGFFAYHLFGQDPDGRRARAALAGETAWVCDSNFLLLLLATECHSHRFAVEAMARMKELGIRPTTTTSFVEEAHYAFRWAQNNCVGEGGGSVEEVYAVTQRLDYYENLFIDGYIRGAALGKWRTFSEYARQLRCGTIESATRCLQQMGIDLKDAQHYHGYTVADSEAIRVLTSEILHERTERGSNRGGQRQARAEAEALHVVRSLRTSRFDVGKQIRAAYFVSTSRLLDQMYAADGLITWSPEALYRHLAYMTPADPDPEALFESMASSYYAMGVSVVDDATYSAVFGGIINSSKLEFEKEKVAYLSSLETDVRSQSELEERFARTPDIEKPVFVTQMAWAVARSEEAKRIGAEKRQAELEHELSRAHQVADEGAVRRASAAEARARVLEAELAAVKREAAEALERARSEADRKQLETERQAEARERNSRDPAHLRKRLRQAKKKRNKNARRQ